MPAPYWLNDDSRTFLARGYLAPGQRAEARIARMAAASERILGKPGFAAKFEDYVNRGWYSLSSPVWSNFGLERGLPISCNGSLLPDDTAGILRKAAEIAMMTKHGAGTSAFFGDIRPRGAPIRDGGTSSGPVHFLELFDKVATVISQGNVRRGAFAAYLPVEHPDIMEFLRCRSKGHPVQHVSLGVCIGDAWMEAMVAGDTAKREVWLAIIKKRYESGYPYLFFTDAADRGKPQVYKDKNLKIRASNLCSEIFLSSEYNSSFVCCLSSMNLLHYDDWKGTDAVQTLCYFLDAVMSEYIQKAKSVPFLEDAVAFAESQRAIGVGVLGWHNYLQEQSLPFESLRARALNLEIRRHIQRECGLANRAAAAELGEPPLLKGYGLRWTTTNATAPTTSSSFILGQTSPSDEPLTTNYFMKDLEKSKVAYRNPSLRKVLAAQGLDTEETWRAILMAGGSVQKLNCLSDHEKEVFRTFGEISQREVVLQAAQRQPFIDQGQSLNLMIHPKTPYKETSDLMTYAWRLGVKSLYYHVGSNLAQELGRSVMACASCEA